VHITPFSSLLPLGTSSFPIYLNGLLLPLIPSLLYTHTAFLVAGDLTLLLFRPLGWRVSLRFVYPGFFCNVNYGPVSDLETLDAFTSRNNPLSKPDGSDLVYPATISYWAVAPAAKMILLSCYFTVSMVDTFFACSLVKQCKFPLPLMRYRVRS